MSIRYGNKVDPLIARKSNFYRKDRFDTNIIKKPENSFWVRPSQWKTMPSFAPNEQKIAMLVPVYPNGSNYLSFTIAGAYTVDWGDGSAPENYASGTRCQKEYDFDNGDYGTYSFGDGLIIGESTASFNYWNGAKLAIVTVTPQVGQNITSANFNQKFVSTSLGTIPNTSPIIELVISAPNMTSLTLGNTTASAVFCKNLINFRGLNLSGLTSFASLFASCNSLSNVEFDVIGAVTSTVGMFTNCTLLKTVPLFNTSNVISMTNMFNNCPSLITVPLFDTSNCTNMSTMFSGCSSLITVPLFNTAKVASMNNMFGGCSSLITVPLFDTSNVNGANNMFTGCRALKSVPLFNTSNFLNMSGMFSNCFSLKNVPLFDTSNCTNMSSMFAGCSNLVSVPSFNTSSVTDMSSMFNGCLSIEKIPTFDTVSVVNMSSMFTNCNSLVELIDSNFSAWRNGALPFSPPLFNTSSVTNMQNMFNGCLSLKTVAFTIDVGTGAFTSKFAGIFASCPNLSLTVLKLAKYSLSLAGCNMSKESLENTMSELGTIGAAGQILTISNNPGSPTPISINTTVDISIPAGSTTISLQNVVGLETGMQFTGNGSPLTTGRAVTLTDAGDIVTLTSHGLENGDTVSFSSITTTTGIVINKMYTVINKTTDTFQLDENGSLTPVNLVSNGNGTIRYASLITAIVGNSITVSRPTAQIPVNTTLSFRQLATSIAIHKGWSVTG